MIVGVELLRLVNAVVKSVLSPREGVEPTMDAQRELLIEFAGEHGLDIQDVATLFRVASGEAATGGEAR